jgi:hypothetical protein
VTATQDLVFNVYQPIGTISLANNSVTAYSQIGAVVGGLTTNDPNANQSITYNLSGTDGSKFQVDNTTGNLETNMVFTATTATNYSIIVTATDTAGLSTQKSFTITVNPAVPTNLSLSNSSVDSGLPTLTKVGTFSSFDANPNQTVSYSFTTINGVTNNNSLFTIDSSGNLLTNTAFQPTTTIVPYTISVMATDSPLGLQSQPVSFTINVLPPFVAPTVTVGAPSTFDPSTATPTVAVTAATSLGHAIVSWTINFGDGTSTTVASRVQSLNVALAHAYPIVNTQYTITASVMTDNGRSFNSAPMTVTAQIVNPVASFIATTSNNMTGQPISAGTLGMMTSEIAILQASSVKQRRQIIQGILTNSFYRVELVRALFLHFLGQQPTAFQLGEGLALLTLDKHGNFQFGALLNFILTGAVNPDTTVPYTAADIKNIQKEFKTLTGGAITLLTSADPVLFLLAASVGGSGQSSSQSEVSALSSLLATSLVTA